ncbi:MAG TPA: isoleucine--tRNA ligase [Candidatus Paceibacterota bacterium]
MKESATKSDVTKREEEILEFWKEKEIFKKSLEKPAPKGEFVFYDGPPFATGLPHYGHILASIIKDAIPRYKTMRGYRVPRVWGWDCHGLPIENIVEKELGFKHKKDITEYGIAEFNKRCREQVLSYVEEWEKVISRIGRFVDMEHAYKTMDKKFMESVWWVFKQIYEKGLVYEDYRSMHICPRCETTLSQAEVAEGYKEVRDIAVTTKFKLKKPEILGLSGDVYLLAWTTTPWTLPGNVALAVGRGFAYTLFQKDGQQFIASDVFAQKEVEQDRTIVLKNQFTSYELEGLEYEALFDYYATSAVLAKRENGWKVYVAGFVTAESGTGVVHIAPAFGNDDWELSKRVELPFVQHVNFDGTIKAEVKTFAGIEVKPKSDDDKVRLGTDIAVIKHLQEHNRFFSKENITHSYPHCWRCDTPLLNYATSSWFVSVTKMKDDLLKNAQHINWSPAHIKGGRFGKWLENARDWSISRQRFWATVIPMWVCEKCEARKVFGSASELEEASGKSVDDLHKHVLDEITVPCPCGSTMWRIPDVLDTWFDSGSMPYASRHYPFESKEEFDAVFPAQFISEGQDQTRAWFYYLHVLAGALFNKHAFENVVVNGTVLAEDGKKMSKRLKNYPDPMEVVEKYGADAMRFYLLSSPVVAAEDLAFSEKGVDEIAKKNVGRLLNVLAFYQLYDTGVAANTESGNILDRWVLARLDEVTREVTDGYEQYKLDAAVRPLTQLIDDLSVWYVRRSRERFKKEDSDADAARSTLRYVLKRVALLTAPVMPFIAEGIYRTVREDYEPESVHLADWPEVKEVRVDTPNLLASMLFARNFASMALMQRSKVKIPVRQPLSTLKIKHSGDKPEFWNDVRPIIEAEANVKSVVLESAGQDAPCVILDTTLSPELIAEGDERTFARAVAEARKVEGYSPEDRVHVERLENGKHQVELSTGGIRFDLHKVNL